MNNEYIGERLLGDLQELEVQLMHSGRAGLLSLIEACIEGGWNTEEAILAKVRLSVVRTFGTTRGIDQRSVGLVLD